MGRSAIRSPNDGARPRPRTRTWLATSRRPRQRNLVPLVLAFGRVAAWRGQGSAMSASSYAAFALDASVSRQTDPDQRTAPGSAAADDRLARKLEGHRLQAPLSRRSSPKNTSPIRAHQRSEGTPFASSPFRVSASSAHRLAPPDRPREAATQPGVIPSTMSASLYGA